MTLELIDTKNEQKKLACNYIHETYKLEAFISNQFKTRLWNQNNKGPRHT